MSRLYIWGRVVYKWTELNHDLLITGDVLFGC